MKQEVKHDMISSINLNDKDYEELIREALAQIPLYSSDWTNYNASDPGITILENLSAFAALQQSEINEVPEAVKWKLLELAGFRPRKGAPAVEYIKPVEKKTADKITADYGQKIYAQDICFELPDGGNIVAADLLGIYAVREAREGTVTENLSALAENYGIPGGVELWGAKKEQKETLYLLLDGMQEKRMRPVVWRISFSMSM